MEIVHKLKEAKKWFENNSNSIMCMNNRKQYVANDYESARNFYSNEVRGVNCDNVEEKGKQLIEIADQLDGLKPSLVEIVNGTSPHCINFTLEQKELLIRMSNEKIKKLEQEMKTLLHFYPQLELVLIMHKLTK